LCRCLFFAGIGLCLILASASCAQKRLPPGGPEDKSPPQLLATNTDSVNVRVKQLPDMYFRFDEMLDQGSLNKALKVMPPDFSFIIDWHDFSSFTLRNPDTAKNLREPVIVSLSRELTDLRRNPLPHDYHFVFSPTDSIPRAALAGKLYEHSESQTIYAWAMHIDSTKYPTRIAALAPSGGYRLSYLVSAELYRAIVVNDLGQQGLLDSDDDIYLPYISPGQGLSQHWLPLPKSAPYLYGVEEVKVAKKNYLHWYMEEYDNSIQFQFFSEQGSPLAPDYIYHTPKNERRMHAVWRDSLASAKLELHWFSAALSDTGVLLIELAEEMEELSFQPRLQVPAKTLLRRDSVQIGLQSPSDSLQTKINLKPSLPGFTYHFLSPVQIVAWSNGGWPLANRYVIEMQINGDDSTYTFPIEVVAPRDIGSLSGTLNYNGFSGVANVVIREVSREWAYSLHTTETKFEFDEIRAGFYSVSAWLDVNNNHIYDRGSLQPYTSPEPFWFGTDTLKIRKRWENSGTRIIF
jgi:hypothetical protein